MYTGQNMDANCVRRNRAQGHVNKRKRVHLMKIKKSKKDDGKVVLDVTASAADVNKAFGLAELDFAKSMGLTPVPDKTIQQVAEERMGIKNLDSIIEANAVEALAPFAIDQSGIDPSWPPQPHPTSAMKRNHEFTFTLEVTPKPAYELKSYDPVEITLPPFVINEEEVDAQISKIAEQNTTYVTADPKPLEKGDSCLIAIKCFEDGKELTGLTTDGRTYVAGEGYMPASFDEHIFGMEPGETREFTFEGPSIDEDYNEVTKKFECTVTLHEIQKPVDPVIDDEWLKKTLPMYKSLDELRADIRKSIEQRDREQYEMYKRQAAVAALSDRFEGRIADEVYETARDNLMRNMRMGIQQQGISWEDYVKENGGEQQLNMMIMLQTREMVVQGYVLDAIFRHENMGLSEDDINAACLMMAPQVNPKQTRQQIEEEGKGFVLRESAQRLKANKWVADTAKVTIQQ